MKPKVPDRDNGIADHFTMQDQNSINTSVLPVTIRLPKSGTPCPYSNLRRSTLNMLILPTAANNYSPPVKSIVVKSHRNASRGVRLIVMDSLRTHLESLISESTA